MKGFCVVFSLIILGFSCNQNSSSTQHHLDSIGTKFDSAASKTWDSTKSKAREIREKVEGMIENRDSLNKK